MQCNAQIRARAPPCVCIRQVGRGDRGTSVEGNKSAAHTIGVDSRNIRTACKRCSVIAHRARAAGCSALPLPIPSMRSCMESSIWPAGRGVARTSPSPVTKALLDGGDSAEGGGRCDGRGRWHGSRAAGLRARDGNDRRAGVPVARRAPGAVEEALAKFLAMSEYCLVFTVSRGSAFRLFADCYPFGTKKWLLTMFDALQ